MFPYLPPSSSEQRLLFHEGVDRFPAASVTSEKGRESNIADSKQAATADLPERTVDASQRTEGQYKMPRRLESVMQELGRQAPTFRRILMSTDQDLDALASSSKEDFRMSEQAARLRQSLTEFIREVEDGMKMLDRNDPSFEQAFATIGRSMDKHIKPLMETYRNNPAGLLEDMSQIVLHDEIESRRNPIRPGEERGMFTGVSFRGAADSWRQSFEHLDAETAYDTVLLAELKKGRTIAQIREEYAVGNQDDREKMEAAIKKLLVMQNTLLNGMLAQLRKGHDAAIPGLELAVDPDTFDITVTVKSEGLAAIREMDSGLLRTVENPDNTIDLVFRGTTYRLRPTTDEKDPALRTYRVDIAGVKELSGI